MEILFQSLRNEGWGAKTRPLQLLVILLSHFFEKGSPIEMLVRDGKFEII